MALGKYTKNVNSFHYIMNSLENKIILIICMMFIVILIHILNINLFSLVDINNV